MNRKDYILQSNRINKYDELNQKCCGLKNAIEYIENNGLGNIYCKNGGLSLNFNTELTERIQNNMIKTIHEYIDDLTAEMEEV